MEEVIQYVPNLYATFWALIPPLVAIILALITKEVYSSLFVLLFDTVDVIVASPPPRGDEGMDIHPDRPALF